MADRAWDVKMGVDRPLGSCFLKLSSVNVHRGFFFFLKEKNQQFFKNLSLKFQLPIFLVEGGFSLLLAPPRDGH